MNPQNEIKQRLVEAFSQVQSVMGILGSHDKDSISLPMLYEIRHHLSVALGNVEAAETIVVYNLKRGD